MLREQPPAHERMRVWIAEMKALARRHPHRYASLDEAIARMQEANPRLTPEQARHLTIHGSYRDEDGTYLWKFDNYVRATSPYLFNMHDARDLWTQITCPVLLLRGTESWASDPEIDGRAKAFRNYTFFNIEGAGHWVHHDQLGGLPADRAPVPRRAGVSAGGTPVSTPHATFTGADCSAVGVC